MSKKIEQGCTVMIYRTIPIKRLNRLGIHNLLHLFRKGKMFEVTGNYVPESGNINVDGWYMPRSYFKLV